MLTAFGNKSFFDEAIKNGADGYVLKDLNNIELIAAIKAVYSGLMVINQGLIRKQQQSKNVSYIDAKTVSNRNHDLTWIEYNILKYIVKDKSSKEIAYILGISNGSVRNKISSLITEFGVGDRTSLAVYAVENGYV